MDKTKMYLIGFYIVFIFDICVEFGFIIRLIIGFIDFSWFTLAILAPTIIIGITIIYDSLFLSKFNNYLNQCKSHEKKYLKSLLKVK